MKFKSLTTAGLLVFAVAVSAGPAAKAGLALDDGIITAKIKSALVQEPATKAREVKVKTLNGVVQLSGFVASAEAKQRAEVIAGTTEGVTDVRNNLQIRAAATTRGEKFDDSTLATKVKAALIDNKATKAREIKVSSLRGVVQLSGFVTSIDEKVAASKVAANVRGVKNVENDLEIHSL
ncbi:MAG: BON domain-containing protein [Pseudomonadota bacterium]|nr:BON domain-containing protein [Pseudomonadota bacterium]